MLSISINETKLCNLPNQENVQAIEEGSPELISMIGSTVIGRKTKFTGPFGEREVVYCDYTASGRSMNLIEHYIMEQVLPLYSNINTNTTVNSKQTLLYRQEARDIIRNAVNASQRDAVIFVGSESMAPVQKLIQSLKLQTPPVVFVGPFQPNSNLIPWTEIGSEIVRIQENAQGLVDMKCLETNLQKWQVTGRRLIGYFSAASNITGILSDDVAITVMLHHYGARAFWDFTSSGPHININMNPVNTGCNQQVSAYKDAIFLSPSMLIGGVQSPGVLIAKKSLLENVFQNDGDDRSDYINHWDHRYLNDIEMREEGGMQSVVGAVRAGLAFQLKEAVGTEYIVAREQEVSKKVLSSWSDCPNLVLLGNTAVPRLPIFSFLIKSPSTEQFLHHNFVGAVLNDVFGIQASGGCVCAGHYARGLLGIDKELAKKFEGSSLEDRPGFTCISLPYFMDSVCVDFVIQAVCMTAKHAWKLLPQYVFNAEIGEWTQRDHKGFLDQRSLTSISYSDGKMTYLRPAISEAKEYTYKDCLKFAQKVFLTPVKIQTPLPEQSVQLDSKTSTLQWFYMLPSEALTFAKKSKPCQRSLLKKVPFEPEDHKKIISLNEREVNKKDETSVVKRHVEIRIGDRRYACKHCNKTLTTSSALKTHMRTHTGKRPFACKHCDKTFTQIGALRTHMRTHTGERLLTCKHCDKTLTVNSALKTHMRTHTGERPFACKHCDKTFIQSSNLKTHMRTHTGKRSFACSHCDKTFSRSSILNAHVRTHVDEQPYACSHCNKTFTVNSALMAHMRTHTGERPFACKHCEKTFIQSSNLKTHMRTHTGERPFACKHCDQKFRRSSHLKTHMRIHTGERPFACKLCDKTFTQIGALRTHMRTHTGERLFTCKHCDKTFMVNSALMTHIRTHTGERPFACKHCDKTFIQSSNLKTHMRTHTGERPFACKHCDKTFIQSGALNAHVRTHIGERPYACSQCDKTFTVNSALKTHMRTHTGERPFACKHCDKTFTHSGALKKHMRTRTGERSFACKHCDQTLTASCQLKTHMRTHTAERSFACKHCDKTFIQSGALNAHVRTHTGERPYACSLCDKTFTVNSALRPHMRTHTGERPFACKRCDKTFIQSSNLKTHMRIHTGDRPFACKHCGQKFSRNGHIKTHMRIHTGERPFACKHCDKTFTQSGALKTHIRTHTAERSFACKHCDKTFSKSGYLKTHTITHTGERPYACTHCDKIFTTSGHLKRHMGTHIGERS